MSKYNLSETALSHSRSLNEEDLDGDKSIKRFPWFRDISRKHSEKLIKEGETFVPVWLITIQIIT